MSKSLFVSGFDFNTRARDLALLFEKHVGKVTRIDIPFTKKHIPFAFVEFATTQQSDNAIRLFDQYVFKNRPLKVHYSFFKRDHTRDTFTAPLLKNKKRSFDQVSLNSQFITIHEAEKILNNQQYKKQHYKKDNQNYHKQHKNSVYYDRDYAKNSDRDYSRQQSLSPVREMSPTLKSVSPTRSYQSRPESRKSYNTSYSDEMEEFPINDYYDDEIEEFQIYENNQDDESEIANQKTLSRKLKENMEYFEQKNQIANQKTISHKENVEYLEQKTQILDKISDKESLEKEMESIGLDCEFVEMSDV